MLKLKQQILGLKNIDALDDELTSIENIQLSESFVYSVQQWQLESIIDKTYLLLRAQEQSSPNVQNMDNNSIVYLINRNIKMAVMCILTKISMKRINSLSLSEQLLKFFDSVIDFIYDMLVQDEIAQQCYGYACFKTFEKIVSEEEGEVEIFDTNYTFKISQKIRRISKHLLQIYFSNQNQASELFLEKYEMLMMKCLKSPNYFSQQCGIVLLSNIVKVTETCYHTGMYSLIQEMGLNENILIQVYRLFALLSPEEQLVKNIFNKIGSLPLSSQINFLNNFIHDGSFQDICYSYHFQDSKYNCFVQEYSNELEKQLNNFYRDFLAKYVDDVISSINETTADNQQNQIERQKVISVLLRNAKIFNINTFQLYSDLKQSLSILQQRIPNNIIFPYIVNNLLTIILQYNQALFLIQEIAVFLTYLNNQSIINNIIKAKIFFLLSYASPNVVTPEVQDLKQVKLKTKFGKLLNSSLYNVKLEYFVLHTAELYLNNPIIEDLETHFDEVVLQKILHFIRREEQFTTDKSLGIDPSLQNTKTTKSFSTMVENLQKSASILLYINKIKSLIPTIPITEKENISSKLNEILDSINI